MIIAIDIFFGYKAYMSDNNAKMLDQSTYLSTHITPNLSASPYNKQILSTLKSEITLSRQMRDENHTNSMWRWWHQLIQLRGTGYMSVYIPSCDNEILGRTPKCMYLAECK